MQKKYLTISTLVGVFAVALITAGTIYAQTEDSTGKTLIQKIAERFNLNEDDVQQVFTEHKAEMKEAHQAINEEKLNALVSEGKLTEDQKNALIQKIEEMKNAREGLQDLTPEEQRQKMQEEIDEFKTWLEENNINIEDIGFGMGFGGRGGPGGGMERKMGM